MDSAAAEQVESINEPVAREGGEGITVAVSILCFIFNFFYHT
jgi:hypothetical protein